MSASSRYCIPLAIVKKVAAGVGNYPDTFLLSDKPAFPIKSGIRLRLYSLDNHIFTHLGWVEIGKPRVIGKTEVEFVCRKLDFGDDDLVGDYHFLVVERGRTEVGWSLKSMRDAVVSKLKTLSWHKGGVPAPCCSPIPPPPPPPSSTRSSTPSWCPLDEECKSSAQYGRFRDEEHVSSSMDIGTES